MRKKKSSIQHQMCDDRWWTCHVEDPDKGNREFLKLDTFIRVSNKWYQSYPGRIDHFITVPRCLSRRIVVKEDLVLTHLVILLDKLRREWISSTEFKTTHPLQYIDHKRCPKVTQFFSTSQLFGLKKRWYFKQFLWRQNEMMHSPQYLYQLLHI